MSEHTSITSHINSDLFSNAPWKCFYWWFLTYMVLKQKNSSHIYLTGANSGHEGHSAHLILTDTALEIWVTVFIAQYRHLSHIQYSLIPCSWEREAERISEGKRKRTKPWMDGEQKKAQRECWMLLQSLFSIQLLHLTRHCWTKTSYPVIYDGW